MARTLIGELILRLRDEMSGQAKGAASSVSKSMSDIEKAAKRLSSAQWGTGFQRQLDKLKVGSKDLKTLERSWISLQNEMQRNNFSKAMRGNQVAAWKTATLSGFTQVASGGKAMNRVLGQTNKLMSGIAKSAMVAAGGYTAFYIAGMAGKNALTNASEAQRTKYRMRLAGMPSGDQKILQDESARLSGKYGIVETNDTVELARTAWALMGGDVEKAKALLEPIVKTFITDVTSVGVEKAGENLTSFLKAMDNLNINEGKDGGVGNINAIMEGWVRAKQIEGKDIDIGDILQVAQKARAAKYGLSDEFLTNYMPALMQDQGPGRLGDGLSGAFQNFVTPSDGGKQGLYLKRQKKAGLRNKDGSLLEQDLFLQNPYEWANQVLKPILAKNGTDISNPGAVAADIKKLASNSNAAGMLAGFINAFDQIEKNVKLYKDATGTADAENARKNDPFAAFEDVKKSFADLAAAMGEYVMPVIVPALNALADTIRALSGSSDTVKKIVGAGAAAGGALGIYGMFQAVGGLITAGANLNLAAAALLRAAVVSGGADVLSGGGGKGIFGRLWGFIKDPRVAAAAAVAAGGYYVATNAKPAVGDPRFATPEGAARATGYQKALGGQHFESGRHRIAAEEQAGYGGLVKEAQGAGDQIKTALSPTGVPQVDTSAITNALSLARQLATVLGGIPAMAASAAASAESAIRQSHADFGGEAAP